MRFLFLIPELRQPTLRSKAVYALAQSRAARLPGASRFLVHPWLYTKVTFGGTLNIMRHCAILRGLGVDAAMLTPRGGNSYGEFGVVDAPYVSWSQIRPDDIVVIPDFCSSLVNRLSNRVIVYQQVPIHIRADFDYRASRVKIWTDSPFMLERCNAVFPGKDIPIVPNIVDPVAFPFRPQSERSAGLLMAFPRKGPEFIDQTEAAYAAAGGKYFKFERIDGIPLHELARRMAKPQVFLASAEMEGCALPPQECMAAGIVVVGRSARGANFAMEHRKTAMLGETPQEAAVALRELESAELRESIAANASKFISRYFPTGEPRALWQRAVAEYSAEGVS
jgi:hypothetical protein